MLYGKNEEFSRKREQEKCTIPPRKEESCEEVKPIMTNSYVKKINGDTEVSIESVDQYGNTSETFIDNYLEKMILFIHEDQVIVAAKTLPNISYVVKVDKNNSLIIRQNGEILGEIRDPEDLKSIVGAEDVKAIEVIFAKMLLEQTEKQYEPPFGEIHQNVRKV